MSRKYKILMISPQFPYPNVDGGKNSIARAYETLVKLGGEVLFVTFDNGSIDKTYIKEAEKFGEVAFIEHNTNNSLLRAVKCFAIGKSMYFDRYYSRDVATQLNQIIGQRKFDFIFAEHSYIFPLADHARALTGAPLLTRLNNIEWMIWRRYYENLSITDPKKLLTFQQYHSLKKEEIVAINGCDAVFTVSNIDKARALELCPKAIAATVFRGVDSVAFAPDETIKRNPCEMILATTYKWKHNADGLRWFLDSVLPIIRKSVPEAFLSLFGKNPPSWLEKYNGKNVNVMGFVPKIQPYLNRASVYVAPLFVGSGIRMKIMDAMAMQLPVVATKVAAEGIEAQSQDGLFVTDSPQEFAEIILKLFSMPAEAAILGKKAREYVLEHFCWEKNMQIVFDTYNALKSNEVATAT